MSSQANPAAPLEHTTGLGAVLGLLRRQESAACAVLCIFWFGLTSGLRPLANPDEGRYVGVAWEMMRSGDWLVPTLNGAPFFHKPPLFYWTTVLAMSVFGPTPWAARIGPVLATTLLATLVFRFVRRQQGRGIAATTVVVLVTMPLFYGSSQYANLDSLVAACVGAAILFGAEAALAREKGQAARLALLGAFLAAAFGVLAKGLIGIVLPGMVLVAWALATGRMARTIRLLAWPPGWAAFLGVAAPWFVAMHLRFPDFGHYFFVVQHVDRFFSADFNNAQPVWFYPALLAITAAPWSPWLLAGLRRARSPNPAASAVLPLMTTWAAVVTVFFSVPHSKPIGYILPAVPPLAWLVANAAGSIGSQRLLRRDSRQMTALLAAAVCIGTVTTLHFVQPKSQSFLGAELLLRRLHGEPVFFVDNYYFDLPIYANLDAPVRVVDDWSAAELAKDSWRRELADGERFLPPGAPSRRIVPADLPAAVASGPPAWIVGPLSAMRRIPWLTSQKLVLVHDGTALWRSRPDGATGVARAAQGQ